MHHYTKLKRDLFLTNQPIDRAEIEILTNLVNALWRLRRTERHESDLDNMVVATHLRDWTSRNPTLDSSLTMPLALRQLCTFDAPSVSQISRSQSRFTRMIDRSPSVPSTTRLSSTASRQNRNGPPSSPSS